MQLRNTTTLNVESYALKTSIRICLYKKISLSTVSMSISCSCNICSNRVSPLGNNRKIFIIAQPYITGVIIKIMMIFSTHLLL